MMFVLRLGTESFSLHLTVTEARGLLKQEEPVLAQFRSQLYDALDALKEADASGHARESND